MAHTVLAVHRRLDLANVPRVDAEKSVGVALVGGADESEVLDESEESSLDALLVPRVVAVDADHVAAVRGQEAGGQRWPTERRRLTLDNEDSPTATGLDRRRNLGAMHRTSLGERSIGFGESVHDLGPSVIDAFGSRVEEPLAGEDAVLLRELFDAIVEGLVRNLANCDEDY